MPDQGSMPKREHEDSILMRQGYIYTAANPPPDPILSSASSLSPHRSSTSSQRPIHSPSPACPLHFASVFRSIRALIRFTHPPGSLRSSVSLRSAPYALGSGISAFSESLRCKSRPHSPIPFSPSFLSFGPSPPALRHSGKPPQTTANHSQQPQTSPPQYPCANWMSSVCM